MSRELVVRLIGDDESLRKAFMRSTKSAEKFSGTVKEQAAQTITARVQEIKSLQTLSAEYALVAKNAARGSEVQVTAARLAADTQRKLEASQGLTQAGLRKSGNAAKEFDRDFSHASRGALAGSGIFRGLGRSIAFASGGFLAFATVGQFLRKSVDASLEAQVVQKQLAAQFRASGRSVGDYQKQIEHTSNRLSLLAGFQNDELKSSFTTIFRVTGNVGKSLRDLSTATDLARARHLGLAQASTIIAKVEGGRFEQLRRQGIQVAKNAKVEQVLAIVRAKFAGQARAGTTQQERFGAVLHDTEEIIGAGLLPTLNKYLAAGAVWLTQMNDSGELQKKVASAAHGLESAFADLTAVVKTVDRVTGGFKHTLELLIGLKVASSLAGMAGSIATVGKSAKTADGKVSLLRGSLSKLAGLGLIVVSIELLINRKEVKKQINDVGKTVQDAFVNAQQHSKPIKLLAKGESEVANAPGIKQALGLFGIKNVTPESLLEPMKRIGPESDNTAASIRVSAAKVARETTYFGVHVARAIKTAQVTIAAAGHQFTALQRNTFFDNAIARILLRGGLGDITRQIGALQKANALIAVRLKATKDVTRRLNLEDELLQNAAQIKGLQDQATQDALQRQQDAAQKRQDAVSEFISGLQLRLTKAQATAGFGDDIAALKALQAGIRSEIKEFGNTSDLAGQLFDAEQQLKQARTSQITARQFRQLGLTAAGDEVTPGVKNLKKQVASITDRISGTKFDTPKLRSELARFRKVLSEGLVPKDVRAKIRDMINDIRDELGKGRGNLTKFSHVNSDAIVRGLGLSPDQTRELRSRISQIGAGGSAPGTRSLAFAQTPIVIHNHNVVELDGQKVAQNTTRHQQRRRSTSRRG